MTMDFSHAKVEEMLARADVALTDPITEKLYRYVDDGMAWRLAVSVSRSQYWWCFENDKHTGVLRSRETAKAWVEALV